VTARLGKVTSRAGNLWASLAKCMKLNWPTVEPMLKMKLASGSVQPWSKDLSGDTWPPSMPGRGCGRVVLRWGGAGSAA
jgi:hypothetical protein